MMSKNTLSILSMIVFGSVAQACPDFPITFSVAGSTFSGEEFQLRKTSNGPVFYNDGTEVYFNPAKKLWCMNASDSKMESKEKEKCITSTSSPKGQTLQDSAGKVIGVFKPSAARCMLLQSIRADGTADLAKPYLEICDQSQETPYRGKMVVNIKGSSEYGYAEVNGPNGSFDANGWISFPRTRSLGGSNEAPTYDTPKSKEAISKLNGKSMVKGAGCGFPKIEETNAAGATSEAAGTAR